MLQKQLEEEKCAEKLRKMEERNAYKKQKEIEKQFIGKIRASQDLNDQLQDLNDYIEKGTNATAVYIGRCEQPKKPITDTDNDRAHIDKAAPAHIHF